VGSSSSGHSGHSSIGSEGQNLAVTKGMPKAWKMAKIIPLHKKGDKDAVCNYRPISNLSSLGKFFEKVILKKINEEGSFDGEHQHGFRQYHSTTTAILDLQRIIARELDDKKECMVYSVDLSAAFDLLRKDTLDAILSDILSPGLRKVIYDFLSERKCVISANEKTSREFDISLGCVQGSVLGPKLFNLYTRLIPNNIHKGAFITTYADDSYVVVSAPEGETGRLESLTHSCLESHVSYLKGLGMVVNQNKTEFIHITRKNDHQYQFTLPVLNSMKVLGVTMDKKLSWSEHIAKTVNKLNGLTGALKFVRKRLTRQQFLQVLTSQYYGTCYYASPVWLGLHTKKIDIKKLTSLHYRLLRTVIGDWKQVVSKRILDNIGRVGPELWSKYITASTVIKILRDGHPVRLNDSILKNIYVNDRSKSIKFFDRSHFKAGKQSINNRLGDIFQEIKTEITLTESNDTLRRILKKSFGFPTNDRIYPQKDDKPDRKESSQLLPECDTV
jgi:hypothetical protein